MSKSQVALVKGEDILLYSGRYLRYTHPGLHRILHHEDRTGDDCVDHSIGVADRSDTDIALWMAGAGAWADQLGEDPGDRISGGRGRIGEDIDQMTLN